jgi:uncharacterized repeat protein (TIGR03803 family)
MEGPFVIGISFSRVQHRSKLGKEESSMKILRITCMFGGFLSLVLSLSAQTFRTLHNFDGTDGSQVFPGLVQAANGYLYGATADGGANSNKDCVANCGTVFKITPNGTLTTLYSFCAQSGCSDGAEPQATLVQDTDGYLYGTTFILGANGGGTVFKISLGGELTTLYNFCSQSGCSDGNGPAAPLVQGTNGNLYGTTLFGGDANNGTVFKITPSGMLTTLHIFDGTDGSAPEAGLVQATDGNFYGTTNQGGANGGGTVFKITPSGTLTTLYNFCSLSGCTDGEAPLAGLVEGKDGNFYGTATQGGANGYGTVFKITPTGTLTTLYSFGPFGYPEATLVLATDGNFYGTTASGGTEGDGTIFSITPSGEETTLHTFDGTDGAFPAAALVQDTNGTFYGTAPLGGANSDGTVFSLSVGLAPFVKALPAAGKVGTQVGILGTSLTGATNVYFNATPALFKVISSTLILTNVPSGATTGTISVEHLPQHFILHSNVPFFVLP